ncbi:MAG: hypothetical protein AAF709_16150 [Pseudomonadota bacterium]
MASWKPCLWALATLACASIASAQEETNVGTASDLDLTAYDISTAQFSILGKRRIDLSFSYQTDSQTTILSTGAAKQYGTTVRYTHPVNDRLEVSLALSGSRLTTDLVFGEEVAEETSVTDSQVSLGARYALRAEQAGKPELTLSSTLNFANGGDVTGDLGLSFVTTSYPAYLYGAGSVLLDEDGYAGFGYNVGVGLAINDRLTTSAGLSGTFLDDPLAGTIGETSYFTTNVTYVINDKWSFDAGVGFGLTDETPDRTVTFGIGYRF